VPGGRGRPVALSSSGALLPSAASKISLHAIPADQRTTQLEERLVDVGPPLVADLQPPKTFSVALGAQSRATMLFLQNRTFHCAMVIRAIARDPRNTMDEGLNGRIARHRADGIRAIDFRLLAGLLWGSRDRAKGTAKVSFSAHCPGTLQGPAKRLASLDMWPRNPERFQAWLSSSAAEQPIRLFGLLGLRLVVCPLGGGEAS
jgi:hypothetical protein